MNIQAILVNKWTTITGIVAGVAQYLAVQGNNPPHDGLGWAQLILGLGLAVNGVLSKDAHN